MQWERSIHISCTFSRGVVPDIQVRSEVTRSYQNTELCLCGKIRLASHVANRVVKVNCINLPAARVQKIANDDASEYTSCRLNWFIIYSLGNIEAHTSVKESLIS